MTARRSKPPASKTKGAGLDVDLLEQSFDALAPQGETLVARFYEELLDRHPELAPLFADVSIEEQEKKLLASLATVVNSLRKPRVLAKTLKDLGARHQGYGVLPEHYPAVAEVLLEVMQEVAGDLWSRRLERAWSQALQTISKTMLGAYQPEERDSMSSDSSVSATNEALARLQSSIDGASTAMMMIDEDFEITYVNRATVELMTRNQAKLARVIPGFDPEKLVGTPIDRFHENPDRQRRLLSDPSNLPHRADIQLLDLTFELKVAGSFDASGKLVGHTLEWADVTDQRAIEAEIARFKTAVDGAQTPLMMVDEGFRITYMNQRSVELITRHEAKFASVFPGFTADRIVGTCIDDFHRDPSVQRNILTDPSKMPYRADIAVADLKFNLAVNIILDASGRRIGNSLEWTDVTEARRREDEVVRLQSAVDGANSSLIMVDRDFRVIYMNEASKALLRKHEATLARLYPGFAVDDLIGSCIDRYHANPAHQRRLLDDPKNCPFRTEIEVGPLKIILVVGALFDAEGSYIGNSLEWTDVTDERHAQSQIERLIGNAQRGELSERLDAASYTGFMKDIAEGMNHVLDQVVDPLDRACEVLAALESGDLSSSMAGEYEGQFARLRDAINNTMENLGGIVGKVRGGMSSIAEASGQVKEGNQDLNERTQQAAAALEECAATVEELTGTVKQNAENSREANQLASAAQELAEKGGVVVGDAVTAMSEINNASRKIADIIGVIDEIAFQTNLLALNAAVEAARAGEQGRGFAVVAAEVRNLAQRSAEAAKEIKSLINDSVDKVNEGSRLVDKSGETLGEIVGGVKKTSDIIAEIAAASEEQATGIDQVSKAISQLDEMTQQNAALVEEAASASETMSDQAHAVQEMLTFFKVDESVLATTLGHQAPPPAAAVEPRRAFSSKAEPTFDSAPSADSDGWEEF